MAENHATNIMPLNQAPFDQSLELCSIKNNYLAAQLQKMGLYIGNEIIRMDETLIVQAIRIRTKSGEVILSGGMGVKTIAHLDDGRRIPLLDMELGETGHIEGITGGHELAATLKELGLKENEQITLLRKLPPMEYNARINSKGILHLNEGEAARIWGECNGRNGQFSLSSVHCNFHVKKLLGGDQATSRLKHAGLESGSILTLESVSSTQTLQLGTTDQMVISSPDGLHLHLSESAGNEILVRLSK